MALDLLAPFSPTQADPWDEAKAAHLCRRAGFGAPAAELAEMLRLGPEAAVDRFLEEDAERDRELARLFDLSRQGFVAFQEPPMLQAWWLFRMQSGAFPLREKMTLFWHGHFATSYRKVENMRLMHGQNEALRRGALGDFRDLVMDVSRDPAMVLWLDNQENRKGHPNENFARELMELFTLGEGHYSERDVQEAARAFTGWHEREGEFFFDREAHDFGRKQVLGNSGGFDGGDIVDIVLQGPQAKRFLAGKLLEFFVMPRPSAALVDEATEVLTSSNLEIKWFLRTIFLSRVFYSPEAFRSKIKSPAEFAVGAVRDLDGVFPGQIMTELMAQMGQELFAPPSVKGWDGERDWISSTAWLARGRFAEFLATESSNEGFGITLPIENHVSLEERDPEVYVDRLLDRLLQNRVSQAARRELIEFMTHHEVGEEGHEAFQHDPYFRFEKARGLVRLILSLPEYHLC